MYQLLKSIALLLFVCLQSTYAGIINVASMSQLQTAINAANPGDQIIVADGVYSTSSDITITKQGTSTLPIILSAKTIGGVEIKGSGGFVIDSPAKYIIIKGFKFTYANQCRLVSDSS